MQTILDLVFVMVFAVCSALHIIPFCTRRVVAKIALSRSCFMVACSGAAFVLGGDAYLAYIWLRIWCFSADTWNGFLLIPIAIFVIPSLTLMLLTIDRLVRFRSAQIMGKALG